MVSRCATLKVGGGRRVLGAAADVVKCTAAGRSLHTFCLLATPTTSRCGIAAFWVLVCQLAVGVLSRREIRDA
jgi:hypothetical protein